MSLMMIGLIITVGLVCDDCRRFTLQMTRQNTMRVDSESDLTADLITKKDSETMWWWR